MKKIGTWLLIIAGLYEFVVGQRESLRAQQLRADRMYWFLFENIMSCKQYKDIKGMYEPIQHYADSFPYEIIKGRVNNLQDLVRIRLEAFHSRSVLESVN